MPAQPACRGLAGNPQSCVVQCRHAKIADMSSALRLLLAGAALIAATGCISPVNPHYDSTQPHHRPGGFQNNYTAYEPKSLWEVASWRIGSWRAGLPLPPQTATAFIAANARACAAMQPAVTWIGHATVLAQFSGLNVITDPVFAERVSPVSFAGPARAQPPGMTLAQLPRIDVVLISHNHYDHLDEMSVQALNAQAGGAPRFVVPLGLKAWLVERGVAAERIAELDWWQAHALAPGVEVVLTPAQHWSGRGLTDRLATLWGGFAVFAPDFHFFYSGDTGYSKDFQDIAARFATRHGAAQGGGFDIALLPIGAYEPRWFMQQQHTNPEESVRIHRELGAKRSLGVHWGTFHNLTDESLDEPPRALSAARRNQGLADDDFFVLAIGQTRKIPRRGG
jgi:N-acyl-phosphatidylethanolamine-hydrolysing phospholipase D